MRKVVFTLTLTFSEEINSTDEFQEIAHNIADALRHECDSGCGLASDESDGYTELIEVSSDELGVYAMKKLI